MRRKKKLYNANKCVFFLALNTTLPFYLFQGGSIQNRKSRRCLELVASGDNEFGYQLALQKCTGQKWFITNMLFSSTSWLTGAPATQKEQHTLKWICVCVCACACTRCVRVRVFVRKKTVHDRACLTLRFLLVSSGQRAVNFYKRFILDKGSAIVSGYFIRLDDVVYSVYFMVTTVQSDFCWLHRCKRFQYALVLCSCLLLCSNVSEPDLGVSILFQCLRFVSLYVQPWEKAPMKS